MFSLAQFPDTALESPPPDDVASLNFQRFMASRKTRHLGSEPQHAVLIDGLNSHTR